MQQLRIPGAIVYVNDPGQGSWSTALGMGNLATREPMQVTNYMRVGSIAKTFTATIILQLVDQHKLRLDDPVSKYQPQVPNGAHITIRELLNMSSGLFAYDSDEGYEQAALANPYKVWQPEELLAIAFKHPQVFAPGKGYLYDNTNYILLGLIMQQLTHLPGLRGSTTSSGPWACTRPVCRLPPPQPSQIRTPRATCTDLTLLVQVPSSM